MSAFAGTGQLVRLALRRDRIMLPAWLLVFVLTAAVSASATTSLYSTLESRVQLMRSNNSTPALVALYGRIYNPSLGAVSLIKLTGMGAALVAVLSIVIVVRHSRAEEETGRLELLGATVVGRHAPLTAALITAVGANVLLGVLTAVSLVGAGLPLGGSIAFGVTWAGTGTAFAAIAAVAVQLTASARTATAIACTTLATVYLLRAVGDTTTDEGFGWLSWLSPIGWGQQLRPFAGDRWWVSLVTATFAIAIAAAAYVLVVRRDLGSGLFNDRPGPADAPRLRTPLALAWRLQRASVAGWTIGFVITGVVLGSVANNIGDLLDSDEVRDLITKLGGEHVITDAFLAAETSIMGLIAAAFGIQAAMRLHAEEAALRAEPVLAGAVGRTRWVLSYVTIAIAGTATLLIAFGLGAGVAHAIQAGDATQVGRVVAAAMVQLPAAAVLTGIVVLAHGFAPRLIAAGWAALTLFLVLGQLGPVLNLSQWAMDVSPYTHTPRLPGADFTVVPLVWLTGVALLALGLGLSGFHRRDIGV